jgi:hypothetical protein
LVGHLGSVVRAVMRNAECPVEIIPDHLGAGPIAGHEAKDLSSGEPPRPPQQDRRRDDGKHRAGGPSRGERDLRPIEEPGPRHPAALP